MAYASLSCMMDPTISICKAPLTMYVLNVCLTCLVHCKQPVQAPYVAAAEPLNSRNSQLRVVLWLQAARSMLVQAPESFRQKGIDMKAASPLLDASHRRPCGAINCWKFITSGAFCQQTWRCCIFIPLLITCQDRHHPELDQ